MAVRLDLNGLLAATVGADGVAPEDLATLEPALGRVRAELAARRATGGLEFADLPYHRDDVRRVIEVATAAREEFDTLVVLGIGGSALGASAICAALPGQTSGLHIVIADAIDPEAFGTLLEQLDLRRTLFNVVSKSGETAETMAQFLIVRDRLLRELGAVDYKRHLLVTSDAQQGALRQIVNDEGFRALPIPAAVGGRFSVLTTVGLFPAAAAGVDVEELLAGAASMDERSKAAATPLADPPLALGGLLTVVGSLASAITPNHEWFLLARFTAGAGAALTLTAAQIILADITTPARRGRTMAVYQGVFLFAAGIGPFPGGVLAERFGLAAPFAFYAGMNATAMSAYRMLSDLGYVLGPVTLGLATDVVGADVTLGATALLLVAVALLFARLAPESYRASAP